VLFWALFWIIPQVFSRLNQVEWSFSQESKRSAWSIGAELFAGYQQEPFRETQRWLILGVDAIEGSNRTDVLTDTIILASYDPAANTLKLLSFPRDIYLVEQRTRLNAVYQMAKDSGAPVPEDTAQQIFSEIIEQPIGSTIVISLDELAEIIDILGGLPIVVQNSFSDPAFPRSGVDVAVERDPTVLYEGLSFVAGPQVMDGDTALKFIRSRKAIEPEEAGDEARARRQRQVIEALIQRLQSTEILANPAVLGRLYSWYSDHLMPKVPLSVLGRLAKTALDQEKSLTLESISLPVTDLPVATESATLFVHPSERKYNGAWVYEPVDPTWEQLREFIREKEF